MWRIAFDQVEPEGRPNNSGILGRNFLRQPASLSCTPSNKAKECNVRGTNNTSEWIEPLLIRLDCSLNLHQRHYSSLSDLHKCIIRHHLKWKMCSRQMVFLSLNIKERKALHWTARIARLLVFMDVSGCPSPWLSGINLFRATIIALSTQNQGYI